MADLSPKERLQPSLLDRLTDDEPDKKLEGRDQRVLSPRRLKDSVLRDLAWLFNTGALDGMENLDAYPEVARSVLNYGIQNLAGITVTGADLVNIERRLRKSVQDFEPRIMPTSLKVKVLTNESMNAKAMVFTIEGDLWAQPLPLHLYIRTEIDLESGQVQIRDLAG